MAADGELLDLVLTEPLPIWQVRAAVAAHLPDGWRLTDLYDVWLGSPPLPARWRPRTTGSRSARAHGRDRTGGGRGQRHRVAVAAARPDKGGGTVRYDLRPLLIDLRVVRRRGSDRGVGTDPPRPVGRTRRPDEVMAALADAAGMPLAIEAICRERLLLVDELV